MGLLPTRGRHSPSRLPVPKARVVLAARGAARGIAVAEEIEATDGVFKLSAEFSEDAWLCLKYETQQMLEQMPSGGAIVNTSLMAAGPLPSGRRVTSDRRTTACSRRISRAADASVRPHEYMENELIEGFEARWRFARGLTRDLLESLETGRIVFGSEGASYSGEASRKPIV